MSLIVITLGIGAALLWAFFHVRAWRMLPGQFGAALFIDFILLSIFAIGASNEIKWVELTREDGVVEWGTFFLLLTAAGVYVWRAWGGRGPRSLLTKLGEVLLALFCVVVAGEEISWGQRLFGFVPPEVFLRENVQQEFNFHNFLQVIAMFDDVQINSGHIMALFAIVFAALVPLTFVAVAPRTWASARPLFPSLTAGGLMLFSAVIIFWAPKAYSPEVAELVFAAGILVASLGQHDERRTMFDERSVKREHRARSSLLLRGTALVAAPVALAVVTDLAIAGASHADENAAPAKAIAVATAEVAFLAHDLAKALGDVVKGNPKADKQAHHKRIYTGVGEGLFGSTHTGTRGGTQGWTFFEGERSFEDSEMTTSVDRSLGAERRAYFIDPWGSPYWFHSFPRRKEVVVYSFGPDRRRDVDTRRRRASVGDDIVIRRHFAGVAERGMIVDTK